ncbi:hypothetical protein [Sinobaca sp. H24]|uniref:hypothetical protein n=1 Tax=Sinobaca sp. H24 TaxID=2923376 RepID=UPI0020797893|nr:hypothetical protein [Sinobaca sp. H24]
MKKVYIHVGFHKTATTFLQRRIYPKMQNVTHIKNKHISETLYDIRLKSLTDGNIELIRERFEKWEEGKPLLISYEGLSGSPFSQKRSKQQKSVLQDLRRVFPADSYDVRIIIGIREQVKLVTSLYLQYIHQGGTNKPENYFKDMQEYGVLDHFYYDRYLEMVEDIFGQGSYYCMVYETFNEDINKGLKDLLAYMGEDMVPSYSNTHVNRSFGAAQAKVGRRLNYLFKTNLNPNGKLPIRRFPVIGKVSPRRILQSKASFKVHYKRYMLPESLHLMLKEKYVDSNRRLKEKYKVKLPENYAPSSRK